MPNHLNEDLVRTTAIDILKTVDYDIYKEDKADGEVLVEEIISLIYDLIFEMDEENINDEDS